MLELTDVSLAYPRFREPPLTALAGINLKFGQGERWAVIGPSGCGKTSLLFILAGLIAPTGGKITWDERPLYSLILQDYGLFPWKTALENAELGLILRGFPRRTAAAKARAILSELGLECFLHYYPSQLSGGQCQRTALARALAVEPAFLLLDEPLGALDALTREQLQDILLKLWQKYRFTLVLVTHDITEAVCLGAKIAVFTPRPGRLLDIVSQDTIPARDSPRFCAVCSQVRLVLERGIKQCGSQ